MDTNTNKYLEAEKLARSIERSNMQNSDSCSSNCSAAEVLEAIEKAHNLVGDLAAGTKRWQMTVPVDMERDSDMILADALNKAGDFIKQNA